MNTYRSTIDTRHLERIARRSGLDYRIVASSRHNGQRFFAVSWMLPYQAWITLGRTMNEAYYKITAAARDLLH